MNLSRLWGYTSPNPPAVLTHAWTGSWFLFFHIQHVTHARGNQTTLIAFPWCPSLRIRHLSSGASPSSWSTILQFPQHWKNTTGLIITGLFLIFDQAAPRTRLSSYTVFAVAFKIVPFIVAKPLYQPSFTSSRSSPDIDKVLLTIPHRPPNSRGLIGCHSWH